MTGDEGAKTSWLLEGCGICSSIKHSSPNQCMTFLCIFERLFPKKETELHLKFMKGEQYSVLLSLNGILQVSFVPWEGSSKVLKKLQENTYTCVLNHKKSLMKVVMDTLK